MKTSAEEDDLNPAASASTDPVKDYLKQIGRVPLLNAEQEVELAKRIEAGLFAAEQLGTDGEPLLADVRVRRALLMAMDRQTMVDRLFHGTQPVAGAPVVVGRVVARRDLGGSSVYDRPVRRHEDEEAHRPESRSEAFGQRRGWAQPSLDQIASAAH